MKRAAANGHDLGACAELLRTPLIDQRGVEFEIAHPVERAKYIARQEIERIRGERVELRRKLAELDRQEQRVTELPGLVRRLAGTSELDELARGRR